MDNFKYGNLSDSYNEDLENLSEVDKRLSKKRRELESRQKKYKKTKKWWQFWL